MIHSPYRLRLMYNEIIKGYDIVKAKPCDKMNFVQSVFERQELNSDQFVQGVCYYNDNPNSTIHTVAMSYEYVLSTRYKTCYSKES